jgi:TonB-dependent receptor
MYPSVERLSNRAKTVLLGSTILAGLGTAVLAVAPAYAQATTPAGQEAIETVVVTGIRASLQSAQAIKQNADQVVDAITAVDIGALPDRSVAEALQRVPGVQVTRTDQIHDPLRWAGYGNGVNIRGLSWVNSEINGFETFGAENGRTISFADISPSLMAGVDVYKNPDSTMIEGGVGGVVNLRTRMPFDADGQQIAVDANMTNGDISQKTTPTVSALYSNRFDTKVGEIGFLVSGEYEDLRASNGLFSLGAFTGTCGAANTSYTLPCPNGQQVYFPVGLTSDEQVGYRQLDWKQPRVTFDGTFQWRPNDKLEFTLIGIWTKAEPQSFEHNVAWDLYPVVPQTNQSALPNYKFNSQGFWDGGTIYNAFENSSYANYFDARYDARHHITADYSLGMKYDPTDNFHLSMDAAYIDSRSYMYSMTIYNSVKYKYWCHFPENNWSGPGYSNALPPPNVGSTPSGCYSGTAQAAAAEYFPNAQEIDVTSNFAGGSPTLSYNAAAIPFLAQSSSYLWAAAMDHVENSYAHSWATRADGDYDFTGGISDWLKDVRFGFRADLKEATTRVSNWNWGKLTFKIWSNGWTGVPNCGGCSTAQIIAQEDQGIGDFSNSLSSPYVVKYNFPNLFSNKMPAVWEPNLNWMQKGIGAVWLGTGTSGGGIQAIEQNATTYAGISGMWQPLYVGTGCNPNKPEYLCEGIYNGTNPTSNGGGINAQSENTYAGYAQFDYHHDTFLGTQVPIDGTIGVRVIHTDDISDGYLILGKVAQCPTSLSTRNTTTCAGEIEATQYVSGLTGTNAIGGTGSVKLTTPNGTFNPSVANSYTDVLPSFNFTAHLADDLQARLAFSQGVVRPDLSYTQNYTLLGFNFNQGDIVGQQVVGGVPVPCAGTTVCTGLRGSGGNPYLKPMHANNYDASLEWYFAPTGSFTFALFHKDISDYFMSATTPETYTINGLTETFSVWHYANGGKGKLEGFEAAYQQFFDSLPGVWGGLGVQANYTKLYNHGGVNSAVNINNTGLSINGSTNVSLANSTALPMEGMSNDSFNLALLYSKYGFDGRLAYNWRSKFLVNSSAVNLNEPVWQENYGQLDASLLYNFLDNYKVGIQVSNLLKQTTILDIGGYPTIPLTQAARFEWVEGERKISLVLRASW